MLRENASGSLPRMPDAPQSRRELGLWGLLIAATLLSVALCGELVVRVARPSGVEPDRHYEPGIYAPDAGRGWALLPGYRGEWIDYEARLPTSTNALGYRGPEETPERVAAAQRVLVVGDSVAFGRGVADGEDYPARLEAILAARGRDVAVFNLAVPGYDTARERVTLAGAIDRIDPQLVALGWYRNDITDTQPAADRGGVQVIDGQLVVDVDAYESYRRRATPRGLLERSMLLNFVRVRHALWRKGVRLERRRRTTAASPLGADAYAGTLAELGRIQALCAERGAGFVLVVHPALDELGGTEPASVAILREGIARAPSAATSSVVSIAEAWDQAPPEAHYQAGDRSHPNARGHDSIARWLAGLPVFGAPPPPASPRP